ncbi:MAG: roadblock/LC7 domain-containing protein [Anaerolineae bacterium]|nr:roadblock/LC7 domain-containing protein [Anaerolineae bacterium]
MGWFQEVAANPHIDVALLMDSSGYLVATSQQATTESRRVAAMLRAAEVLADGLASELGRGEVTLLQISTADGHLLLMPAGRRHYLVLLTQRGAPLELLRTYLSRLLEDLPEAEIASAAQSIPYSPWDELSVDDLFNALSEWLRNGGDSRS